MHAMTGQRADGGPAFPREDYQTNGAPSAQPGCLGQEGLSMRDYFAAKAMQAAATNPNGADGFTFRERAVWAYEQADAMLEARQS